MQQVALEQQIRELAKRADKADSKARMSGLKSMASSAVASIATATKKKKVDHKASQRRRKLLSKSAKPVGDSAERHGCCVECGSVVPGSSSLVQFV